MKAGRSRLRPSGQQQHPILRRRGVEPRQRRHLQRRRSPHVYRRAHQKRCVADFPSIRVVDCLFIARFCRMNFRKRVVDVALAGLITMEDLISVLPFGGTFDLAQMKGSTLRKAFEHSVKRYGQSTGEFLQVSGIFVLYISWARGRSRCFSFMFLEPSCRLVLCLILIIYPQCFRVRQDFA